MRFFDGRGSGESDDRLRRRQLCGAGGRHAMRRTTRRNGWELKLSTAAAFEFEFVSHVRKVGKVGALRGHKRMHVAHATRQVDEWPATNELSNEMPRHVPIG